tara:strand:+ start:462 stop:809 length:348 start_codon:yes stop_codon:yes gene_type:complete
MKLNDFKDVMDKSFGKRHENISDDEGNNCKFKEANRNTIIITALSNYYDYNELSKEEGREVIKTIQDIQKYTRMIKFDDILDDMMDIVSDNTISERTKEDLKDAIYDYFNELKNK